jgi:hypothetical protein
MIATDGPMAAIRASFALTEADEAAKSVAGTQVTGISSGGDSMM